MLFYTISIFFIEISISIVLIHNVVFISVSSVGFAIVLHLHFLGFIKFLLWVVFVDCIGFGLIVASLLW